MRQPTDPTRLASLDLGRLGLHASTHRGLSIAALAFLLMFIGVQGHSLWREWSALQGELAGARASEVIGYPGIYPKLSFARPPGDWFRDEGDTVLVWAGWDEKKGHSWFRFASTDVQRQRLSRPRGRDRLPTIDHPIAERGGGAVWGRVPEEAAVAVGQLNGIPTAYPMLVLSKVAIVNDLVDDRPFLVTYNPFANAENRVEVHDPVVANERVTLGHCGFLIDNQPVYYDRTTESLWVHDSSGLKAIGGSRKGTVLPRLSRAQTLSFGRWRGENPDGRLVVGSDRPYASAL